MINYNACISVLSSRKPCIESFVKSLWNNYNMWHNYPLYVHYFDDVYDGYEMPEYNVKFVKIPYETPSFIGKKELYYNRKKIKYVSKAFPKRRKGYLHMCNFLVNMYGYPNTELSKYDFIIVHDDEAGYNCPVKIDPVNIMANRPEHMGAYIVGQRLKDRNPHQGHLDTRIGLWDFTKDFIVKNSVNPASERIKELLHMEDKAANWRFHFLPWADTYVINTKMFRSDLWKKWVKSVNENGGIYKCRWGDNEIYSLFYLMYSGNIYNLGLVEDGYHDQGMFRKLCSTAPGVKDNDR